jgi:hypothetical protein
MLNKNIFLTFRYWHQLCSLFSQGHRIRILINEKFKKDPHKFDERFSELYNGMEHLILQIQTKVWKTGWKESSET